MIHLKSVRDISELQELMGIFWEIYLVMLIHFKQFQWRTWWFGNHKSRFNQNNLWYEF